MAGSLPHHVRNGGGLEMKYDFNERFIIDIVHEVQRMSTIHRNCVSLLEYLKPGLSYPLYITLSERLDTLDKALSFIHDAAFLAKLEICDTQL